MSAGFPLAETSIDALNSISLDIHAASFWRLGGHPAAAAMNIGDRLPTAGSLFFEQATGGG
jgi:hypothetical protein